MWLHRENDYEWKYVGIWMDMVPLELQSVLKNQFPLLIENETLLLFDFYKNPVDMIQQNLKIRNQISSIKSDSKLKDEEKSAKIMEIEKVFKKLAEDLSSNKNEFCLYLNDKNEFKNILIKN